MKLSDIDEIQQAKSKYHSCRDQLAAMKKNACCDLRFFNQTSNVTDPEILGKCRDFAISTYERYLDELKTKLMLFGVDDFEGYD